MRKKKYHDFSDACGIRAKDNRLRVWSGSSTRENKIGLISVVKDSDSGIMSSGVASGARNHNGKAADKHAEKYYRLVRSMTTDVKKIARTTGYSEKEIQEIKNFIFMDKHDLGGNKPEYFKPDYMMAESWQRLIQGTPKEHDLTLIRHEIMEKDLMKKGLSQEEAHKITSKSYNYGKEADEFYGKIKKYKKE